MMNVIQRYAKRDEGKAAIIQSANRVPMAERIFITIGSNIDPERHLPEAVKRLAGEIRVVGVSRVYETAPVGATGPNFLNAAVMAETDTPPALFKFGLLRPIEALLGRVRTDDKNAPRTIDLDIALYGQLTLDDPRNGIRLPDPDILTRAHVALPLADLDPNFVHPVTGETLGRIAARFKNTPGVSLHPLKLV